MLLQTTPNANNLTAGAWSVMSINDRDAGVMKGDAVIRRDAETIQCTSGLPEVLVDQLVASELFEVDVNLGEIVGSNIARAALNLSVEDIAAGAAPAVVGALRTPYVSEAPGAFFGREYVRLAEPPVDEIAGGTTVTALTDLAATPLVVAVDYEVDPTDSNVVYRIPTSVVWLAGASILASYTHFKPAMERIAFGLNSPPGVFELILNHVSPRSGRLIEVYMPAAQGQGSFEITLSAADYWNYTLTISGTLQRRAEFPDVGLGLLNISTLPASAFLP